MNEQNLTPKQQEVLKSFRSSVADVLQPDHDDFFLLRWLRARNYNEEKAEAMLRKHMKWRKDMKMDTFLNDYEIPEVYIKYHPGGFLGHDKEGCPVWLINCGDMDLKGIVSSSRSIDFLKFQIRRFETIMKDMKEQGKKMNKRIEKKIYIIDDENLNVGQLLNKQVMEYFLNVVTVFEANYPETLKRCYILNVPKLFYVFYSLIKPMLSEETASKIRIYGYDGWREAVLEDIDASVLPVRWGGTRVDPITGDPACPSLVNPGGTIPESYYLSKQKRLSEESDTTVVFIPRRSFVDVKVQISKVDSVLQWDIQTEENDLAIGLFYENDIKDDLQVILECKKIECNRAPESGIYACPRTGTYVLRLDNTYSWFNSKRVHYRITVTSPTLNVF